jgi:glycosyltransferase involved in cell wall biosynthesis
MVVLEAYACGTPVLASRIGSLDEIVVEGESGIKFEPRNAGDLAVRLNALLADRATLFAMRAKARALFDEKYTAARNYSRMIDIYAAAVRDFHDAKACRR